MPRAGSVQFRVALQALTLATSLVALAMQLLPRARC